MDGTAACSNLAVLYRDGRGGPKDRDYGIEFFRLACKLMHETSCALFESGRFLADFGSASSFVKDGEVASAFAVPWNAASNEHRAQPDTGCSRRCFSRHPCRA